MPSYNYRSGAGAAVMDEGGMTGIGRAPFMFLLRAVRRRPHDAIGILVAAIAAGAIMTNALYLQPQAHPAPIFPAKPRPVATDATGTLAVAPRPRPIESDGVRPNAPPAPPAQPAPRSKAQILYDIQRELQRRGFYDGPIDGLHGPRTDTAIRDFQQAAGMKTSVEIDEALLRTIARSTVKAPSAAPPSAAPTKRPVAAPAAPPAPAAPSKRVLAVQRALADFGYGQVAPTGVFDADTKAAIERFERERKLPVTGQISDRLTRELAAITGRPLD